MADFVQLLMDMRNGKVAADIGQKFQEVLDAVLSTGGKGKLTIEIDIAPEKMEMGGLVAEIQTSHSCKLKKPEKDIGRSIFFVTKSGDLTRDDPDQMALLEDALEKDTNDGRKTQ